MKVYHACVCVGGGGGGVSGGLCVCGGGGVEGCWGGMRVGRVWVFSLCKLISCVSRLVVFTELECEIYAPRTHFKWKRTL